MRHERKIIGYDLRERCRAAEFDGFSLHGVVYGTEKDRRASEKLPSSQIGALSR